MSYLGTQFAGLDPEIEAERNRMAAEREAKIAEMKAAELAADEVVLPVLRLVEALEAVVPAERMPALVRGLRGVKPGIIDRALSQLETRHMRREREQARLREAALTVANLEAVARRQAELAAGAL